MQIKTSYGDSSLEVYQDALSLRQQVFVSEQGFAAELDVDEYDQTAFHVVLYVKHKQLPADILLQLTPKLSPIGVLRAIRINENTLKIGRVAILPIYRGKGLGQYLMKFVEAYASEQQINKLILSAQYSATQFYQKLDYHEQGTIYDEEGVDHILMLKYISI